MPSLPPSRGFDLHAARAPVSSRAGCLSSAPELIGATLLVDGVGGTIVEVEAYHHTDPAAQSYLGAPSAMR